MYVLAFFLESITTPRSYVEGFLCCRVATNDGPAAGMDESRFNIPVV